MPGAGRPLQRSRASREAVPLSCSLSSSGLPESRSPLSAGHPGKRSLSPGAGPRLPLRADPSSAHALDDNPSLQAGNPCRTPATAWVLVRRGCWRGLGLRAPAGKDQHPQVTYRSLLERSAEVEHGRAARVAAGYELCLSLSLAVLAEEPQTGALETLDVDAAALRAVCPPPHSGSRSACPAQRGGGGGGAWRRPISGKGV